MTLRLESEGEESFSGLLTVVVPEDGYEVKQRIFLEAGSKGFRSRRKLVSDRIFLARSLASRSESSESLHFK
jgi:hypothetical protein